MVPWKIVNLNILASPGWLRLRGMKSWGFVIGLNTFSLLIYLFSLAVVVLGDRGTAFRSEAVFFLLFLCVSYPALFFIDERWKYLVLFAFRGIALGILFQVLCGSFTVLLPLLAFPTVSEIALYLPPKISLPLFLAVVSLLVRFMACGFGLRFSELINSVNRDILIEFVASIMIVSGAGLALILMVYYREKTVKAVNSQESMSMVIGNVLENNMKLQFYAVKEGAESAKKERQYITREIHDIVGYALSNVTMVLNAARITDSGQVREELLTSAKQMVDECLKETRTILHRLRVPEIEYIDSHASIRKLVKTFESATGIKAELHFTNFPSSLDDEVRSAFYRFIQVGLTNSFTHGSATRVKIILGTTETELFISLWDNGRGIPQNFRKGIGLTGMSERLDSLGGALAMANCVDGFSIKASVPLSCGKG